MNITTSWTKENLAVNEKIKFKVRAVDNNNNYSAWSDPTVEIALLTDPPSMTSITAAATLINGIPSYCVNLVVPVSNNISGYKYFRKNPDGNIIGLTPSGTQLTVYSDTINLIAHGQYEYGYSIYNSSGESNIKWADQNTNITPSQQAPKVYIPNISPGVTIAETRPIIKANIVTFTLGAIIDAENDQLEYRLYTRANAQETPVCVNTWIPTVVNQQVSFSFTDNTTFEWYISCVELNSAILDKVEIVQTPWQTLRINSQFIIAKCFNTNNQEGYGTVGETLRCEVSTAGGFNYVGNFQWNFGDGGERTGSPLIYSYSTAGSYQVQVSVRDADGTLYIGETQLQISVAPPRDPGDFSTSCYILY